jgi:hypothetical protein
MIEILLRYCWLLKSHALSRLIFGPLALLVSESQEILTRAAWKLREEVVSMRRRF